ncbi:MAG: hypothetical protein HY553_15320 [Elusimicrobia bacterium]|nr:hypothetical protein [Elusimicrobiota bacterium]
MGAPRPPGPAGAGRRSDLHLLFLAQQQIEQLQLFSARLQQQIRNLQAQLQEADQKVEDSNRSVELRLKQAEALRRALPKLRERLSALARPKEPADPKREKRLAGALAKLNARLEGLEAAHDKQLQEALKPKPKEAPPAASDDGGELSFGEFEEGGGLQLDAEPVEGNTELLDADDPFSDLDLDSHDEPPAASPAQVGPGAAGGLNAPAPFAELPPRAPAGPPPEFDAMRREVERLRHQQKIALVAVAAAITVAIGLSLRGRPEPAKPPPPPAAPAAGAVASPAPLHAPTLAERALKLVQELPVGRDTIRQRLALMTSPGAPLPEDARWRVGLCESKGCDVSYSAGLVDPATGAELLYLFHADVGRKDVRGLNEPARVILKKR